MASSSPNDVNYFVRNEQGKVLKVLKHTEVKQESMNRSVTSFSDNSALIEHSELKSTRHVKMTNTYKLQYTENNFGVIIGREETSANNEKHHIQLQPVKYGPSCAEGKHSVSHSSNKCEGKIQRSIINHKSKAHTNTLSLQRKRKPEKAGKGLRHFSMKVCEKVKEKGATTYNEVADELVTEEIQNQSYDSANCDQKNIRRRVYDALNVLMAMNIISKDKKEIRWIGLPTNSVEKYSALEKENKKRRERIEAKHQQLRELILQQVSFRSLVERNKEAERKCIIPTPNSSIQLPFIIVNTHKSTKINCSVTNDKSEYIFKFDDKFEMHDDAEVLKRMGLLLGLDKGTCTCADIERAKLLVPKNFVKYIEAYGRGEGLNTESRKEISSYIGLPSEPHDFLRRKCGQLPDMRDDTFLDESD